MEEPWATLLLVGAGLVMKSFHRMQVFLTGFVSENLLTMRFYLPPGEEAHLDGMAEKAASVPGVEAAAVASHLYFGGGYMSGGLTVEGYMPSSPEDEIMTYRHFVSPDYFRAMGIPVLRGRSFDGRDREDAPPVAVVNESFARKMWPEDDALGKRVMLGSRRPDKKWLTVVGVVGDVKPRLRLTTTNRLPQVYIPLVQGGQWGRALVASTAVDPMSVATSIRRALQELSPGIAVYAVAPMDELLSRSRSSSRYVAYLMGAFATLALLLAAVGLYGVVSYAVSQRTHEIGIRVALGAGRGNVLGLIMQRALLLVAVGLAVGLLTSLGSPVSWPPFFSKWIPSMLVRSSVSRSRWRR